MLPIAELAAGADELAPPRFSLRAAESRTAVKRRSNFNPWIGSAMLARSRICEILGHRASIADIKFDLIWRSHCVRCHVPLVNVDRGKWAVNERPMFFKKGR